MKVTEFKDIESYGLGGDEVKTVSDQSQKYR